MRGSTRNKIHIFNDLPHLYELEDMMDFCSRYKRLYICGAGENQEYLLKFFDSCGVKIAGYAVSDPAEQCLRHYRQAPVVSIDQAIREPSAGIILGLSDRHHRHFIPKFRKADFKDFFDMTEYNKGAIAGQMKPRPIEEMTFEVNLADHCNLSCQMCDHYSQLSDERFVDIDVFERDMRQMAKLFTRRAACISLLGGEPLLHPGIIRCLEITRREFPDSEIVILTNGLLLLEWEHSPNGNLWKACMDLDIHITVTIYPLKFDYAALERKAAEYGVPLAMSSNIHADELTQIVKVTDKHTFDLTRSAPKYGYVSCLYFNKFNVLREGRYYMCPIAACASIFNKYFQQGLLHEEDDSLDIFKANSWEDFSAFAAARTTFCGYCDLMKWRPHSQWKASTKAINEYI